MPDLIFSHQSDSARLDGCCSFRDPETEQIWLVLRGCLVPQKGLGELPCGPNMGLLGVEAG